jgi:hypothetical protein
MNSGFALPVAAVSPHWPPGPLGKTSELETSIFSLASRYLARTGPTGRVWRCPFLGVDRKWLAHGQNDAN